MLCVLVFLCWRPLVEKVYLTMGFCTSFVIIAGIMAASMIGASYLFEKGDGDSFVNVPDALHDEASPKWNREYSDSSNITVRNTYNRGDDSPMLDVRNSSAFNLGKAFTKSLRSRINHRFAQVLRAMGLSLAIGIVTGICTCFLGPLLWYACLCCLGFQSRGIAAGSIAASLQSWMGNVEAGSCFSRYQSLGTTGLTSVQPIVVVSFVAGALAAIVSLIVFSNSQSETML